MRNAFFSIITFVVTMISGQILTHMAFPAGYQVVFTIGFAGAIATAYQLYKIRPLLPETAVVPTVEKPIQRLPRYLPPLDGPGRHYLRVIGLIFLINITSNMLSPLVPGLLVHKLRLSDAWISIGTALNSLIVFIISLFIARLTRRTGNRGATALGLGLLAGQTFLLAVARDPAHYLASVLAGGLGSGILLTAQFNYHLENVPEKDRSAWLSWNLLLGNAALLLGSLGGPLLAGRVGIPLALGMFGVFRLLTGLLIYRWGGRGKRLIEC